MIVCGDARCRENQAPLYQARWSNIGTESMKRGSSDNNDKNSHCKGAGSLSAWNSVRAISSCDKFTWNATMTSLCSKYIVMLIYGEAERGCSNA